MAAPRRAAAAKKPPAVLVATASFVCSVGDEEHLVHEGDQLPADHPAAKANPDLFTPAQTSTEWTEAVQAGRGLPSRNEHCPRVHEGDCQLCGLPGDLVRPPCTAKAQA